MTSEITVSVFMLTFNQEDLVTQAIEGVLKQKTNFKFQLVIGDDASTDDTIKICKAYQEKFGDVIKLITRDKNIGLIANFIETAKYLTGKYVAICDGDDYWIDYSKLQKQVDFLDSNDDYSIIFGKCYRLDSKGKFNTKTNNFDKTTFDFSDLVMTNFIPSVTVLFRNSAKLRSLPGWFSNLPYGDWPVYLYTLTKNSKIFFLDEYLAVYRVETGESFKLRKKLSNIFKTDIYILENLSRGKDFEKSNDYFKKAIVKKKKSLILAYNRERNYIKGCQEFFRLLFVNAEVKFSKLYFYSLIKTFNA
ncbi:glycosyltransferase [Zunongwangia pacifica]|uniref:Glycosyltransferase n=1 Tax=Zunongwangia pacifica TaxID=2911062 RepID=A0A9X1ZQL2_9FLAO|nr:glycosyltransferase [Zunongwangia pacifica]MCL6219172.1 glycosyltransferase [Zunongwangia pacifica]